MRLKFLPNLKYWIKIFGIIDSYIKIYKGSFKKERMNVNKLTFISCIISQVIQLDQLEQ